jgi:hypothetical protein
MGKGKGKAMGQARQPNCPRRERAAQLFSMLFSACSFSVPNCSSRKGCVHHPVTLFHYCPFAYK